MTSWYRWLLAIRPKTLGISVTPVLVGNCLAWSVLGSIEWVTALATLLAAMLIQIGTNLYNDALDFERGTDTATRLGPKRATAEGWFRAHDVKRAAHGSFAAAFAVGCYLAWVGGWPIVAIGILSLLAGYGYTGGLKPIAYSATGELFVFLFFGLFAVGGSFYVQTLTLSLETFAAASAIGLLASAVLLVNNYRDLETDRLADKITLVYYLGDENSKRLFGLLLILPFALPMLLSGTAWQPWLVLFSAPTAVGLIHRFTTLERGPGFNEILADTAKLQLLFGILIGIGIVFR